MALFKYTTAMNQLHFNTSNTWTGLGHLTNTQGLRDSGGAGFYVMKGTPPTQSEFDAFTAYVWRSGDILISKSVNSAPEAPFDTTNMLFKLALESRAASASGYAEWFLWRGGPGSNAKPHPMFMGTITEPGGTGDLTLYNQNIVSGVFYNIGDLSFDFSKREFQY